MTPQADSPQDQDAVPAPAAAARDDAPAQARPADPSCVKFDSRGLVPCIVQEWSTGEVLMLAYMNQESLQKTLETGYTWFYSRSRQELWNKGATSGHLQRIRELRFDCDCDTLLALVEQTGVACHTGDFTCFDCRWLGPPTGEQPAFLARRER